MTERYFKLFHTPQEHYIWNLQKPYSSMEMPDSVFLLNDLDFLVSENRKAYPMLPSYYSDFENYQLLPDLFSRHFEIVQMPDFIEVYAYKDMQETLDIMIPPCKGNSKTPNLTFVQTKFIEEIKNLGFSEYRTYPVRVYYVSDYMEQFEESRHLYQDNKFIYGRPTRKEAEQRFEYHDDRFVILQLTKPPLEFFKPLNSKAGNVRDKFLEFRDDFDTFELPLLFRIEYKLPYLFCNARAKLMFEKYRSLALSPGSQVHRGIRGNRPLS